MPYGYQQWLKYEGKDAADSSSVRAGALTKVLEIIENLKYPRPGWGLIRPDELDLRLKRLKDPQGAEINADWDKAIADVLDWIQSTELMLYCKERIDPKAIVTVIKKMLKEDGGNAPAAPEPDEPEEEAADSDDE